MLPAVFRTRAADVFFFFFFVSIFLCFFVFFFPEQHKGLVAGISRETTNGRLITHYRRRTNIICTTCVVCPVENEERYVGRALLVIIIAEQTERKTIFLITMAIITAVITTARTTARFSLYRTTVTDNISDSANKQNARILSSLRPPPQSPLTRGNGGDPLPTERVFFFFFHNNHFYLFVFIGRVWVGEYYAVVVVGSLSEVFF